MSKAREKMEQELTEGLSLGHEFKNIGSGMGDVPACSYGWKGMPMWDDPHNIHAQWYKHVQEDAAGGQKHVPLDVSVK